MRRLIVALAVALAIAAGLPVLELPGEQVQAALTTTKTNGGGKTPGGNANGVPSQTCNSGGNCPAGQNK